VAPGGPLDSERIEAAADRCRVLRLEPVVFPSASARHRYLAGTDEQRITDLQDAFDDPSIDAVWALRGGYGTQRILDRLDLARQREDAIPFIGFSDNTTIHARHAAMGVISFHGPHPAGDFPAETEEAFRRVLFSADAAGELPLRGIDPKPRTVVEGQVEAPLLGGNLTMLASLCGTRDAVSARDRILFLEDVGEPAYRVDRMLMQLQRCGALDGLLGLAMGRFTESDDDRDHPVEEVLAEFAEDLGVPAVLDLPVGHVEHNWTLPVGALARLDASTATLTLLQGAVRSG
jgi:muramoyltetrapeptide carboxypeptidase